MKTANPQRHKTKWAEGLRPTIHLTGYRTTKRPSGLPTGQNGYDASSA